MDIQVSLSDGNLVLSTSVASVAFTLAALQAAAREAGYILTAEFDGGAVSLRAPLRQRSRKQDKDVKSVEAPLQEAPSPDHAPGEAQ